MKNRRPKEKVIVITGPTSSGKSSLAVKIAKKFNGEIISADSRQIYQHLNLGSGKVEGSWKKEEKEKVFVYQNIPHHLIDFLPLQKDYNVAHFQRDCLQKIDEISRRKKLPIICGGTGFWIRAVVYDLKLPKVKPNEKLRNQLTKLSAKDLTDKLKTIDPLRAETIDQKNPARLIRAIEIATALGKVPPLDIFTDPQKRTGYDFLQVALVAEKQILEEKIKRRLKERFLAGMIEEVKQLNIRQKLSLEKIQSFGLGYFWIPLFLQGKIKKTELFEQVFMAERNYAKRQMTWLKKNPDIIQESDPKKIISLVKNFLAK